MLGKKTEISKSAGLNFELSTRAQIYCFAQSTP